MDTNYYALQKLVWPRADVVDKYALFIMPPGDSVVADEEDILFLKRGQVLDMCTYFNAFSHKKWHDLTDIESLFFRITGKGNIRLRLLAWTATGAAVVISDDKYDLSTGVAIVNIQNLSEVPGLVLSVEITCLSDEVKLISGDWSTNEKPRRFISLLAIITTFKREHAAENAIKRFAKKTIPGASIGTLELLVVDNGATMKDVDETGVRVLKNRNLGGAGGFTRGMMQAFQDDKWTHCLFMDDDASCEAESVWRTMAMMAYASDARLTIAGAMLYSDRPTLQYEKGARIALKKIRGRIWQPLGNMKEMSDRNKVIINDYADDANYGAWWYFCFPLTYVKHWPFPFFVRGDDIDFCISNKFPVETLNGVGSWSENFGYKLNPQTEYLSRRSSCALALMHSDKMVVFKVIISGLYGALKSGMRYDYGSMFGTLEGVKDALQGPKYFAENPAPTDRMAEIKKYNNGRPALVSEVVRADGVSGKYKTIGKVISIFTIGGHLLPSIFMRKIPRHTNIGWDAGGTGMLRSPAAIYGRGADLEIYKMDRTLMFKGVIEIGALIMSYLILSFRIEKQYKTKAYQYRTKEYWEKELFGK
jgi:galactofuranosylgalactofuranosylrhamnosyl-N-acetylglucosaminyl-diphospho-decaprenol beta-1,5/1,6-galactofuranosyltransferase